MKVEVTTKVQIDLTLELAAQFFAGLDDDQQCKFFVEVARIAKEWKGGFGADHQWFAVGSHLRNCSCSTEEARVMIETIAHGLQVGTH